MLNLWFLRHWSTLKKLIWLKAAALSSAVQKIVTGKILAIKDALAMPVQSMTAYIITSAYGIDTVNITHCGKNLWNKNDFNKINAYFGAASGGGFLITSNASHTMTWIPCKPNTTYTVSRIRTVGNDRFQVAYTKEVPAAGVIAYDRKTIVNDVPADVGKLLSLTITTGADAKYLVLWAWWGASVSGDVHPKDSIQIEVGPSATEYAYFKPKNLFRTTMVTLTASDVTFTVNADGTVSLSGTASANISNKIFGTVVLQAGRYKANGFSLGARTVNRLCFRSSATNSIVATVYQGNDVEFELAGESTITVYPIIFNGTDTSEFVFKPMIRYADIADATYEEKLDPVITIPLGKTLYNGGVLNVLTGELTADGETTQITPTAVTLYEGSNTLWSDAGDMSMTYLADGNADNIQALNILLGGRYVNRGEPDEATDAEALDILLGR